MARWWRRRERELEEELAAHFRLAVEARMTRGESRADAEAAARREFGGELLVREATRSMWPGARLLVMVRELGLTLRALRRNPRFSVAAVLCVGVGIGVTMAIVSALYAILLRPLPYPDAGDLVAMNARHLTRSNAGATISLEAMDAWQSLGTVPELAAWRAGEREVVGGDAAAERVGVAQVTTNLLSMLGVRPKHGRWFEQSDADEPVVVLSEELWRGRYGGYEGLLGGSIEIGGQPHRVIGIMPTDFGFPEGARLWVPLVVPPGLPGNILFYDGVVGRLAPGVDGSAARAEFDARTSALAQDGYDGWQFELTTLREYLVGALRRPILIFQGAAALVMLLAFANLTALLLARASAREHELAVRAALGAGGGRLATHVLVECVVLALAGGLLGTALAAAGVRFIAAAFPDGVPSWMELKLHVPVLLVMLFVLLASAMIVGVGPAMRAARRRTAPLGLRTDRMDAGAPARGRHVLVTFEIAASVVLLAVAALLVRTHLALEHSLGFEPGGVLAVTVSLPMSRYPEAERRTAVYSELADRLSAHTQVEAVSTSLAPAPLDDGSGTAGRWGFRIDDQATTEVPEDQAALLHMVSPGYFEALGVPLLEGRDVAESDVRGGERTIVVNESFARRYFPGGGAPGRRIIVETAPGEEMDPARIVGVARDFRHSPPPVEVMPTLYMLQVPGSPRLTFLLQTRLSNPATLAPMVRGTIGALDPAVAVHRIRTQSGLVERAFWRQKLQRNVIAVFAGMALLLAVMGMYGVLSYAVAQRTAELGVRLALGASPMNLLALVLGEAARLAGAGILLGLAATVAIGRMLASLLYGVRPADPATLIVVVATLLVIVLAAAMLPAWRAARLDPLTSLRGG